MLASLHDTHRHKATSEKKEKQKNSLAIILPCPVMSRVLIKAAVPSIE